MLYRISYCVAPAMSGATEGVEPWIFSTARSSGFTLFAMKKSISLSGISRLLLSICLVLWVGGAGCLIGCENMALAAMDQGLDNRLRDSATTTTSHCATATSHSCCAKHGGATPRRASVRVGTPNQHLRGNSPLSVPALTTERTLPACPLAMNAGALANKARADESPVTLVSTSVSGPLSDTASKGAPAPPPAWVSNRGHTYLRCCVFLI